MKTIAIILLLILASTAAAAIDVQHLVDQIGEVETGNAWDGRPGAAGELSCYQITPAVWHDTMPGVPFAECRSYAAARACAVKHVRRLAARLEQLGYRPTPARLALCWNLGFSAALQRRLRPNDYARRVANLYGTNLNQKS